MNIQDLLKIISNLPNGKTSFPIQLTVNKGGENVVLDVQMNISELLNFYKKEEEEEK